MKEKTATKKTADLTIGNVWKVLLLYSLPLFGSAMVQQLYSLADLLIVGNFANEGALAVDAIGNATVIVNLLLAFALGANGGCSVIIAKYFGKKDNRRVRETANTAFLSFAVLCAVVMALGFGFGRLSLKGLSVDDSYFDDGLAYLYIYAGSLPFVFFYNLGCGICSALGDSKTPFIFLVVSSLLNVGLDFLFVCVFHLDVAGAAWATFISQAVSCVLTAFVLAGKLRAIRTEEKPKLFHAGILKELTLTSIPIILQQSSISIGNFFVNKRINMIGVDATTGFTTAFKLTSITVVGIVSMSNGLANFASQNKAAGKPERIRLGFWAELCYALVISAVFLVLFVSCPRFFTRLFIQPDKLTEAAMAYSVQYITIVSCFFPVVSVKIVADSTVRGCGGNLGFTISTVTDLVLRVAFVYLLTYLGWGFAGVSWAWVIGWAIGMAIALVFLLFMLKRLKTGGGPFLPFAKRKKKLPPDSEEASENPQT